MFLFQEMRLIFPNSQRINRGNYEIKQLVQACRSNEVTDLLIVSEHRGNPGDKFLLSFNLIFMVNKHTKIGHIYITE